MGGKALGPVKAQCPSVGQCQDMDGGVDGLVSRGERGWEREVFRGETRKEDNI